jgi:hypothetical protein
MVEVMIPEKLDFVIVYLLYHKKKASRVFFYGTIFFDGTTFWERIVQIDFPHFTLNKNTPIWRCYKHPGQFIIII